MNVEHVRLVVKSSITLGSFSMLHVAYSLSWLYSSHTHTLFYVYIYIYMVVPSSSSSFDSIRACPMDRGASLPLCYTFFEFDIFISMRVYK